MAKKIQNENNLTEMLKKLAVEKYKEGKIKNAEDTEDFLGNFLGPVLQTLMEFELDNHLGYEKYSHEEKENNNARNGYCKEKKVSGKYGTAKVKTPRDRNGTFNPKIIEKGQTKLLGLEEKCISLYAKGMSVRDIASVLGEIYGNKLNKDEVCKLINKVNEEVGKWQNRPLEKMYVFTYADCLYIPIKGEDMISQKKAVYVIIGVNVHGYKDVLGIWVDNSESATFWSQVFTNIKNRGVEDILYMCSDGVAGFKNSLETIFPKTNSQRCVVHLARNLYKICPRKISKEVMKSFKKIYTSSSIESAESALEDFKEEFKKYPTIVNKVESFMEYLEPLFELPNEIRKQIYTTNTIESVNSALRKVTRGKASFPSEESVIKVLYLRINELTKKWNKPIRNWSVIQNQLIDLFGERYTKYIEI